MAAKILYLWRNNVLFVYETLLTCTRRANISFFFFQENENKIQITEKRENDYWEKVDEKKVGQGRLGF
jgi:hypothetical protein